MWAGCIWVPIYEVMTRKRLTMVTLEENLAMAADIGMEATTSLDERVRRRDGAPRARMRRSSCCRSRATSCRATLIRMSADDDAAGAAPSRRGAIRGSTTIVEILRSYPDGEAAG